MKMKRWLDPYSSVLDKLALIMDLIILNICFYNKSGFGSSIYYIPDPDSLWGLFQLFFMQQNISSRNNFSHRPYTSYIQFLIKNHNISILSLCQRPFPVTHSY